MTTIPQLASTLQEVLGSATEEAARSTTFVQRTSKLTGARFVQTLVFGWLENPQATLEELTQTAQALGVSISAQGLDQRFTRAATDFLKQVLAQTVAQVVASDPVAVPLLQRFNGVYVLDSSTIGLPTDLAVVWRGCGNRVPGSEAALKIQVCLEYSTGALQGPLLQDGRTHDRRSPLQTAPLPAGALRLADLGYFSLDTMREMSDQGVYWLTRLQANTVIFDAQGQRQDVLALLRAHAGDAIDLPVLVGRDHQLPCHLVAERVTAEVAERRRRRMKDEARRRQQPVSRQRLELAEWTIYVTNVPPHLLSVRDVLVLGRVRWQIELLIKLWKSHGRVDEWRSAKPWRILCEVYAKLLAMVVQHWLLLVSCWRYADRSLQKAVKTIQKHVRHLELSFCAVGQLAEALTQLCRCLAKGCRINKRKKEPHTYQLLLDCDDGVLA